jgi:type VII secretion integral membrane protein EccD
MSISNEVAAPDVGTGSDTAMRTCRVAVIVGSTQTDMVLPADIAVGSLMLETIKVLGTSLRDQGKDVSVFRSKDPGRWTFSFAGAPPMPSDKTLAELGVLDGDWLVLTRARAAEEFQPLVDDVFDGATALIRSRFKPWDPEMSQRAGGAIAVVGCAAAAALIAVYSVAQRAMWVPAVVALVAAVFGLGAAWLAGERYQNSVIADALVLGVYPLAAVGGAATVPGRWGAFHVVLSAGALVAVAAVAAVVLQRTLVLASAVMTIGSITLAIALVRAFWPVGYVALGTAVTLAAMLMTSSAPKIAMLTARVPLPPVPTLGVTLSDAPDKSPRFIIAGAPEVQQYKAPGAELFEQRTRASNLVLTGIMFGAVVSAVAGTAVAAQPCHRRYWLAFAFSLITAVVLLRRARAHADRRQTAALLAGGSVIIAQTFVRLALGDGRMWLVLVVGIGLLGAAGIVLVCGVTLPEAHFNDVQRRLAEIFEVVLVAVIFPLGLWIMDVFGALRGIR